MSATELTRDEATEFYRDRLGRFIGRLPLLGRLLTRGLFSVIGADVLSDPESAASKRPVFELDPVRTSVRPD